MRGLKPGEIRIGAGCAHVRTYERVTDDGVYEAGHVYNPDAEGVGQVMDGGQFAGVLEFEGPADSRGIRKISRDIKFTQAASHTARSGPSSRAYRSGWDRIFGERQRAEEKAN